MVIISNSLTYEVILESNISEREQNYILLQRKSELQVNHNLEVQLTLGELQ
jgi:hypothetical protein